MTIGVLQFGSGHASVIFEHDLKSRLEEADVPSNWTGGLKVGSDALGWPQSTLVDSGHGHWPVHDSVLGMKQVSDVDGSTEVGYAFYGGTGDADLTAVGFSGCLMYEIEAEAIDAYDATYNTSTYQPANRIEPISAFSGSGNDNIRFLWIESGTTNPVFRAGVANAAASTEMNRLLTGWDLDTTTTADPRMYAFAKGRGRFVRVITAWNGNLGVLMFQDPDDPDNGVIVAGWGDRTNVAGFAEHFNQFCLGGLNGTADSFLTAYYIRNLTLSNSFPVFSLSRKCPKVLGIGDSTMDFVEFGSAEYGGINNGQYGIQRAFYAKGLRTSVVFSENSGQKLDESIVVTPSSITAVGDVATMTTASDPGWQTDDTVSITGAVQPEYNGTFGASNFTRNSPTSFSYTMASAPTVTTATGTITAGRSAQVSVYNILNDHPDARGIVVNLLTNDLNSSETAADSLTDYKALIDKIFSYSNMDFVILDKPKARTSGGDLDLQEQYNSTVFTGVVAYIEATYPSKIVEVADVWTSTGGRSPTSGTLQSDGIHFAPYGSTCQHWEYYQAMLRVLQQL